MVEFNISSAAKEELDAELACPSENLMILIAEMSEELARIDALYKSALLSLLEFLKLKGTPTVIPSGTDLTSLCRPEDTAKAKLFLITEGTLRCFWNKQLLFYLNEMELIGIEDKSPDRQISISSDFAVRATEFSATEFYQKLQATPEAQQLYPRLLTLYSVRLLCAMATTMPRETALDPDVKSFVDGDVIIREGDTGTDVYSMVNGTADVSVKGVMVGQVGRDEIFGTIAAVSGTTRSATVTATSDCTVLVVSKEKFVELMHTKPSAVKKLIEDMSRLIVSLNSRVVGAELSKL